MKYCFGVDIGGTTVKMGLFSEEGELFDKWEIVTVTENQGAKILPDIAASVKEKLAEKGISGEQVAGIGVGVPAPVNSEGYVQRSANLGWREKHVRNELQELTGFPCAIGNDANVAALGEMWKGAGGGEKNMIMVTLGTGVGGGVIIDGHAINGVHGAGGEIGHMHMADGEEETCGCGGHGCLEQYASATGITRLANRRLAKDSTDSVLREGEVSSKSVFDAAKAGDALAKEVVAQFDEYLGQALANLAVVTDPSCFVIGGGVSRAGEYLIDGLKESFEKKAFYGNKGTDIVLASLGNDAGIYGAAKLFLDAK